MIGLNSCANLTEQGVWPRCIDTPASSSDVSAAWRHYRGDVRDLLDWGGRTRSGEGWLSESAWRFRLRFTSSPFLAAEDVWRFFTMEAMRMLQASHPSRTADQEYLRSVLSEIVCYDGCYQAGPGGAGSGNRDGGTGTVVVRTIGVRVSQLHLPKTLTVPVCGWCGRSMVLTRTAVEPKGFEMRSFECPDCDHVVIERVSTDPMETGKGWVEGELRPPG